ncbi:hypothetical protein P43SY_009013 [Pythium insidiosum]|uniref:Uncharacterized protein n=1 Tax=Pythium insidiosum TaxID=114742 RepID=A0AAD5M666_PYTIN|nr:hypothetical protein P43SY_009013 [Pythium insidiosum]
MSVKQRAIGANNAADSAAAPAATKSAKKKADKKPKAPSEDEDRPIPFVARLIIIILSSFTAQKIWTNRVIVSQHWYSDRQSSTERAMITAFEYIVAMGLLFFSGLLISSMTVRVLRAIGY